MIDIQTPFHLPSVSLSADIHAQAERWLAQMTREEKLGLCHANSIFTIAGVPRLGLPELTMSDGPHGVRRELRRNEFVPLGGVDDATTYLPVGIALGATWSVARAHDFGDVLGAETRARGKDVILGPGINLIRTPLCGRNFEYIGEDPLHVAPLAVAVSLGVQEHGVAGSVKHYALNNQELNRNKVNVEADDATLRELYLTAFELVVTRGGCLTVMGAYNKFRGQFCCQHQLLLQEILKDEWGFEGFTVCDWGGVTNTDEAVRNGMDVEMGGNLDRLFLDKPFRDGLEDGTYSEDLLDEKARRVLRVYAALKVGDPQRSQGLRLCDKHRAAARRIAEEAIVLLKNDGPLLPLEAPALKRLLVVGDNADQSHAEGGGSSGVLAEYEITPLQGLREALGDGVDIEYVQGYPVPPAGIEPVPVACLGVADHAGIRGWRCEVFDNRSAEGEPVRTSVDAVPHIAADVCPLPGRAVGDWMVRWTTTLTPETSGRYKLACDGGDYFELKVDGAVVSTVWDLTSAVLTTEAVTLEAGKAVEIQLDYRPKMHAQGFRFGWVPPGAKETHAENPFADVVEKARHADAVIFCGGTNHFQDCEGTDRHSMELPGGQNDLIEQLAAVNEKLVVVLFGGSAVELPWLDRVPAVLQAWYPGQDGGRALADILLGRVNPSGHLPFSWPKCLEEVAAHAHDAYGPYHVEYTEGRKHGTRWHQGEGPAPRFALGHGLSYTRFAYRDLHIDTTNPNMLQVELTLANTGDRAGMEVVQCYREAAAGGIELMNFAKVHLEPGREERIRFNFGPDSLRFWNENANAWDHYAPSFRIFVGPAADDVRLTAVCGQA